MGTPRVQNAFRLPRFPISPWPGVPPCRRAPRWRTVAKRPPQAWINVLTRSKSQNSTYDARLEPSVAMKMRFSAIPDSGAVRLNLLTGLSLKPHRRCRRWHKPAHETLHAATRRRHSRAPISRPVCSRCLQPIDNIGLERVELLRPLRRDCRRPKKSGGATSRRSDPVVEACRQPLETTSPPTCC